MATEMAILQEMDKCMKCRGCQVACERSQGLTFVPTGAGSTAEKVQSDDPMVVKAQGKNDAEPYVRYSCWHCVNPPCASACPRGAMKVSPVGGVYVDKTKCTPGANGCTQQCVKNCRKGGYPKVGNNGPGTPLYAYKCDMCTDRLDSNGKPACVATCPGKALTYDTLTNIQGTLSSSYSEQGDVWVGEGHMFWARKSPDTAKPIGQRPLGTFDPPTTDPYIEDHISPMFSKLLKGTAMPVIAIPALFLGGLLAFFKRRETLSEVEEA